MQVRAIGTSLRVEEGFVQTEKQHALQRKFFILSPFYTERKI
jgi:hypothetical protein